MPEYTAIESGSEMTKGLAWDGHIEISAIAPHDYMLHTKGFENNMHTLITTSYCLCMHHQLVIVIM